MDFGSSVDLFVKGRATRPYSDPDSMYAKHECAPFRVGPDATASACDAQHAAGAVQLKLPNFNPSIIK